MLTYDPVSDLRHYPIPMGKFGLNPFGANLYRIVFAPTRRYLVYGEWPDGSRCAQWNRLYKELGEVWVMERWRPAEEFCKVSREIWNRDMTILGPWPERGEYEFCHEFTACPVNDANLDKLIAWIELGMKTPLRETMRHGHETWAAEQETNRKMAENRIREVLPAYGCRPMFARGTNRGTEKVHGGAKVLRSAQELGLPTLPGAVMGRRARRIIAA